MFYFFILLISILCSTMFMLMKFPLTMGLTLLIQSFLICLMSGLLMKNFWFSYILFIVFLGGILVMFIYVISLASNEMFMFTMKSWLLNIFFMISMMYCAFFLMDVNLMILYLDTLDSLSIMDQKNFIFENNLILNKLYNFPTNMITIMLMIYLFLTLIAIVKITYLSDGPLRMKQKN